MRFPYLATLALLTVAGCAQTPAPIPSPASVGDTAKGKTLTDAKGMTLYTFDKDTAVKSACNGTCAKNWPPLAVTTDRAPDGWTAIVRDDGTKQWAYKGKPLYSWTKDSKPGDITGDGIQWHVAQP
jgi:predicted lipoprotein with Yx(FWY)xxD motif